MLRIGVVGYGTGGRHFHTPFIYAAKNCELAGIVARAHATQVLAVLDAARKSAEQGRSVLL
jgi:predicted dehydrogenase